MKFLVYSFCILILTSRCIAQNRPSSGVVSLKAGVKNWANAIFLFPPNYWEGSKINEIQAQIGKEEYEKVKKYSDSRNIPCTFLIFCENRDGSPKKDIDSLRQKLDKLTAFKIAAFTHTNAIGEKFEMVILRVSYSENKTWDASTKWDTVYFVLPREEVI